MGINSIIEHNLFIIFNIEYNIWKGLNQSYFAPAIMRTVNIIGAGPVGCYLAYLLADRFSVRVFEEHNAIGSPVQCTGILTSGIERITADRGFIKNQISTAQIISRNESLEVGFDRPNIIVDRKKFDRHFYRKAKEKGVKFNLSHRFLTKKKNFLIFQHNGTLRYYSMNRKDILVGADGVHSKVYKLLNAKKRKLLIAPQARLRLKNDNKIRFYFDKGHFAWIVPESRNIVRVGIVVKKPLDFEEFMHDNIPNWREKLIEYQSGCIPLYDPKIVTGQKNIYIVGDAAGQVKATTGGGIIQGLTAAECLAEALKTGKSYQSIWKKKIGIDLWLHLKMHRMFSRMSGKDKDELIRIFRKKINREILEKFERDYPTKYILRLAKEWRLIRYMKYLQ